MPIRLDARRGLGLWFIFIDHTRSNALDWLTHRNHGFSGTSEVFAFASGYGLWQRVARPRLANDGDARASARLGNLRRFPASADRLIRSDLSCRRRQRLPPRNQHRVFLKSRCGRTIVRSPAVLVLAMLYLAFSLVVALSGQFHALERLMADTIYPIYKSHLAPVRLLHFLALAIVVVRLTARDWHVLRALRMTAMIRCGENLLAM